MNGCALKFLTGNDQRGITLAEGPVVDILNPVILEIPAVGRKRDNRMTTREVTLVLDPVNARSCIIKPLQRCAQHIPGLSAALERGKAGDLLAEGSLDHSQNCRVWA